MMELGISNNHGYVSELTNCEVPSIKQEAELESYIKIENVDIQEVKHELTDHEIKVEIDNLVVDESLNDMPQKCVIDDIIHSSENLDDENLDHSQTKCHKYEFDEGRDIKSNVMDIHNCDFERSIYKEDQSSNSYMKKRILKTRINKKYKQKKLHTKETKYKCHYCKYGSDRMSNLKSHINSLHTKVEIHKCQYCDYGSSQMSNLKRHISFIHAKVKIYKCQYCDYRSSQIADLKSHIHSML